MKLCMTVPRAGVWGAVSTLSLSAGPPTSEWWIGVADSSLTCKSSLGASEREPNLDGCRGAVQVHVCLISLAQGRWERMTSALSARSDGWNLCLVGLSSAEAVFVELRHYLADRPGMHRTAVGLLICPLTRLDATRFDLTCPCAIRRLWLQRPTMCEDYSEGPHTAATAAAGFALIAARRRRSP
jgi:MYXO-CTERM domain-containing protein